jgi:hypothetical protein
VIDEGNNRLLWRRFETEGKSIRYVSNQGYPSDQFVFFCVFCSKIIKSAAMLVKVVTFMISIQAHICTVDEREVREPWKLLEPFENNEGLQGLAIMATRVKASIQ